MKKLQKALALVLAMAMCLSLSVFVMADDGDITVLYTNDIHTYITKDITYSALAALKDSFGENTLLVDAGDHIQGTAYGSMDKGETIIKLMNAAGYDLATLGNHEFDYAMEGCMNAIAWAQFPYVSCNFYHEENGVAGETVLDAYKVFEVNGLKIAFIGITTPESFTKSTPAYFQNEKGEYIYGIAGGEDGSALYAAVQAAIDAASAEADVVIALGHLGDDPASLPWTSEEVIANTSGLDAFIDGHSHSTVPMAELTDKDGNTVILTQTGEYFDAVGKMTISPDGSISTELLSAEQIGEIAPDADVKAIEDAWIAEVDTQLEIVIGSFADTMANYDEDGKRLVRSQETNVGDFCADALYYLFANMDMDVDVAIMNGGGVRNKNIAPGEISYKTCKDIHTFGNVACLQTITGQQLLDALEWGAKNVGKGENGGFLHVSGITYEIDATIPSTVQADEKGVWTGGPTGEYRVKNVKILQNGKYVDLDLNAKYNLAGYNYTLRDLGDGFAMFDGAVNVLDYVMEDYMVLANYVKSFENGVVTGYAQPQGRISIILEPFTDVSSADWFHDYVVELWTAGVVKGMTETTYEPSGLLTWGQTLKLLLVGCGTMEDQGTTGNDWAKPYVDKAIELGLAEEVTANDVISREELVYVLWCYAKAQGIDVSVGEDTNILSYEDVFDVDEVNIPAMQWACGAGIIEGDGANLMPDSGLQRDQIAKIICLYTDLIPAEEAE